MVQIGKTNVAGDLPRKVMGVSVPDNRWLEQIQEDVLLPDLQIVDAHHHLWMKEGHTYLMREFVEDLESGQDSHHRVVATVFAECHSMYRNSGPAEWRSLGETEFVSGCAAIADSGVMTNVSICEGIVGNVDLRLGEATRPLLETHITRSGGRFKGVRLTAAWDDSDRISSPATASDLLDRVEVMAAASVMASLNLTLDCWVYHTQLQALCRLADQLPELTIVVNHTGVPVLGGPNRDRPNEVFADWHKGILALSKRNNVFMKLGAVPIRQSGDGVDRSLPPSSEEIALSWATWMLPCIEVFGAERCVFESNFPVQKLFSSYHVTWNAFKRLADQASIDEKHALFHDSAIEAYRLARSPLSSRFG